jgi:pimeloyl-ACP methyl ester carboxylesterase
MPEVRLQGGPVDGITVHYVAEGRGPAVVLVHGLAGFAESWRHNISALAARTRVYALDLPGFGQSDKPPAAYDLAFFVHALRAFLDATGMPTASLVGHSLGGAIAVATGLTHPTRVERLALIGAVVPGCEFRPSIVLRTLARRPLGELLALLGCAPLYRAVMSSGFHRADPKEVDFHIRWAHATRTAWPARAAYLATLRGIGLDFTERAASWRRTLRALEQPVLLIHGREDRIVPPGHGEAVGEALPRRIQRWIDGCGHFPHIEHADVVNEWLAAFLAGRPAAR